MRLARSRYQLVVLLLINGLLLTGCDEIKDFGEKTFPKMQQVSPFFHPIEGNIQSLEQEKTVYVPVYSKIFVSGGGQLDLAITLSLRNTDFTQPIMINEVSYYNTAGELIENYLEVPHSLGPMASTHFFVTQADSRGGVGANFIVKWAAGDSTNVPVIEAVMAGSTGTHGISFINSGREIRNIKMQ
jgi:hypothetical protein